MIFDDEIPEMTYCPACDEELPDDGELYLYCPFCGESLDD